MKQNSTKFDHGIVRIEGTRLTKRERKLQGLPPVPIFRERVNIPIPKRPELLEWFALTTMPQSEEMAAQVLYWAGYAAFNPVQFVDVRASKFGRHKTAQRARAVLTSMVLVGFPAQRGAIGVPWRFVLELEHITGVIGFDGAPAPLPYREVFQLLNVHQTKGVKRSVPAVGSVVTIDQGVWEGKSGQLVALSDGAAKVALFGVSSVENGKSSMFAKALEQGVEVNQDWINDAQSA